MICARLTFVGWIFRLFVLALLLNFTHVSVALGARPNKVSVDQETSLNDARGESSRLRVMMGRARGVDQETSVSGTTLASLIIQRKIHQPHRKAGIVLEGSNPGVPLVQGLEAVVEYRVVNAGNDEATHVKIWESASSFPSPAFHHTVDIPLDSMGNNLNRAADSRLVAEWSHIAPGETVSVNTTLVPRIDVDLAKHAQNVFHIDFGQAFIFEIPPARSEYRPRRSAKSVDAQSTTDRFLVVESALGFERRTKSHPLEWSLYLVWVALLAGCPYFYARRSERLLRKRK